MKVYVKVLLIVTVPLFFWFTLISSGYGAQSLSQIIEIPIVLIGSIIIWGFLDKYDTIKILGAILLFVILLRTFMPQIPE